MAEPREQRRRIDELVAEERARLLGEAQEAPTNTKQQSLGASNKRVLETLNPFLEAVGSSLHPVEMAEAALRDPDGQALTWAQKMADKLKAFGDDPRGERFRGHFVFNTDARTNNFHLLAHRTFRGLVEINFQDTLTPQPRLQRTIGGAGLYGWGRDGGDGQLQMAWYEAAPINEVTASRQGFVPTTPPIIELL